MTRHKRPEPPDPTACCQGGCVPCIFDAYERRLARWEAEQAHTPPDSAETGKPSPGDVLRRRMGG
ncbi:MAG: oxidoreductase-like domain-containing protein [Ectothiorhodospiraceae bacterium]